MSTILEEFNERLEAFVQKYGLSHASLILERISNKKDQKNTFKKNRLMGNFLQLEALETFEITNEQFEENKAKLAREARWAVIHLYRNFTQFSFNKIGKVMGITHRATRYAHEKCEALIEVGKFEQAFNDRYLELEEKLVAFIAKI
jgi:chromosomal replication initiation ATPase DnaA